MRCWRLAAVVLWLLPGARANAQAAHGLALVPAPPCPRASYAGRDDAGVPRYLRRRFSAEERDLLRRHFGIEEPSRLYLSDTSAAGSLVYDTERDPGVGRLVRSYRVGAPSIRLPGESWESLERRIRTLRPTDFPDAVRTPETSLDALAPEARTHFVRMLRDAEAAGHRVRVVESRRSPERQAYLLALGGGLTFTATSLHSSGHAVDVVVGDGDLRRPRTRASWIAFRRWAAAYDGGRFRLIGTPERSWDWPHVELAAAPLGFGSVEALLAAAREAETACCEPFPALVHSSHDSAGSRTVALLGAGGRDLEVRRDGAPGGPAVSAR